MEITSRTRDLLEAGGRATFSEVDPNPSGANAGEGLRIHSEGRYESVVAFDGARG